VKNCDICLCLEQKFLVLNHSAIGRFFRSAARIIDSITLIFQVDLCGHYTGRGQTGWLTANAAGVGVPPIRCCPPAGRQGKSQNRISPEGFWRNLRTWISRNQSFTQGSDTNFWKADRNCLNGVVLSGVTICIVGLLSDPLVIEVFGNLIGQPSSMRTIRSMKQGLASVCQPEHEIKV
jgi:hypothetical protein